MFLKPCFNFCTFWHLYMHKKNHFKHKFSCFENFTWTLGSFTQKIKYHKIKHKSKQFYHWFGDFFFSNPIILVCSFVAPSYAFCPLIWQNWLISTPNRGTLQITLMQKKYMLPKYKMAIRKKKNYWIFSQTLHISNAFSCK